MSNSNEVEEQHTTDSFISGASGTEHPSSPTRNVRERGRKYGSGLTVSQTALKRGRDRNIQHNRKTKKGKRRRNMRVMLKLLSLKAALPRCLAKQLRR
jgi:hypothetical protein